MDFHAFMYMGAQRVQWLVKGRPATVVACERRDLI